MKKIALACVALIALSAQMPASPARHLVYQFGFNTKAATSGNGTGTTTIDMTPASDGGVTISASDSWWNTVRPRATNTCELYANGNVACAQPPYAISPIQLTIFPLLARGYFHGMGTNGSSNWTRSYTLKAAVVPGASGFAGDLNTWNCSYQLTGKGPIPKAAPTVLIEAKGTLAQQGGRFWKASSKQRIAYDPVAKLPLLVTDVRTHLPMRSVYSNDLVDLRLLKDSMHPH